MSNSKPNNRKTNKTSTELFYWGINSVNLEKALKGRKHEQKALIDQSVKDMRSFVINTAKYEFGLTMKMNRSTALQMIKLDRPLDETVFITKTLLCCLPALN